MDEKYRWNYDIKIVTKDGVIKYENEPLENIGKMALKHTPYDSLEATRHKPLIFSEVNEVHKEGKRLAKERQIQRKLGGKKR